jgi:hypothetical protein
MEGRILPTVTIDEHPRYAPQAFRAKDIAPPTSIVLHLQAIWFLDRAQRLQPQQGIGFCGIMTVKPDPDDAMKSGKATIYLWPLQTPHTIEGDKESVVPGMESLQEWPVSAGFPEWAKPLESLEIPALKYFRQTNKNLHVIPEFTTPSGDVLPRAPAHEQFQQAIAAREDIAGLKVIGFSLYYNLADNSVGKKRALKTQFNHHLLRLLSRSQNKKVFEYDAQGDKGKVPVNWAALMKKAFDDYFRG